MGEFILKLLGSEGLVAFVTGGLTLLGIVIPAWLSKRSKEKDKQVSQAVALSEMTARMDELQRELTKATHRSEMLESEINVSRSALTTFGGLMKRFNVVQSEIDNLCRNTEITRVVVLCAWNGKHTPELTTAVYQYRQGGEEPLNFIHLGLDTEYVKMLNLMYFEGAVVFNTKDAPPCLLKEIYENEGIEESAIMPLDETQTKQGGVLKTYISYGTQAPSIEKSTLLKCKLMTGRLSAYAGTFADDNHFEGLPDGLVNPTHS